MTAGYYEFEQTPACGYDQSITVADLPIFATHNAGSLDFTIPQTSDGGLTGEYTVTV